jgi:hypothetical protein
MPRQNPVRNQCCAACCASKDSNGDSCPDCGIWFCEKHTFRIKTESHPLGCIFCMGRDVFFAQLSNKVKPICERAEEAITDIGGDSSSRRQKSLDLERFLQAFDHLSRLGAHWVLEELSPLLLRVVKHLLEHGLASLLETFQAVLWHLPEYLPDELVRWVEKLNISGQDSCRPSAAQSKALTRSRKPTVAVLWHEIHRDQDAEVVLQLSRNTGIEFYILVDQLLDDGTFAADLQRNIPKKCWKYLLATQKLTVGPPTNTQDIERMRKNIRKMGITLLLGNQAWARPGFEVHNAFRFGHRNELQGFLNGVLLDPQCLSELKLDPAEAENIWCISCVTGPWDFKGKLQRGERKPCGSEFRLLALVDPDQPNISPLILEDILLLLNEFPNIRACFCGLDLMQTASIMREMEAFALKHKLNRRFFIRQIEWWGCRPTVAFAQKIRDQIDVCLTTGPGIEGVNVALGTGTPVVAQRAWRVGGKMAGCCASSMLQMIGLGALAVPHNVRPGRLVKALYRDGDTLRLLQRFLDDQNAADGTSSAFFDLKRTAQDLAAVACALHVSDNIPSQNERNCISRPPEQPYFFLGDDGLLHLTASGRVRQADLELGKRPDIPEFRCEFDPDASEMDVDLEHENMDQHESCISSPSRAQAEDATMKDNVDLEPERMDRIDLTHDDSDVHEDGGGVPGEAPSAGDLLGRGAVLHPGPVLTLWTGRRRRRGGGRGGPRRCWSCGRSLGLGGPVSR